MKNKKAIITTVVIFLAIILTFVACKKNDITPIVVTDVNGVPVTDEHGEVITVIPETQVVILTDANGETVTNEDGEVQTTIEYVSQTAAIPVTDDDGKLVTNPDGTPETTYVPVPMPDDTNTNPSSTPSSDSSSLPGGVSSLTALGGTGDDNLVKVAPTNDGGFVVVSKSTSKDGDFSAASSYLSSFAAISKYTSGGALAWTKTIGGKAATEINDIEIDAAGNIYVCGSTKESSVVSVHGVEFDGFIQKYTSNGTLVFTTGWGGTSNDLFNGLALDSKGNIYVVGSTYSQDADASGLGVDKTISKAIIAKFDSNGKFVGVKGYASTGDYFTDVSINSKDEIYACGIFSSKKDTSLFTNKGYTDIGVFKFNSNLSYVWAKSFGGSKTDNAQNICATDDGCIIAGFTASDDGNLASVGNKGGFDALIVKWTSDGSVSWFDTFNGNKDDRFIGVTVASDGSVYATGYSQSATRDFGLVGNQGSDDGFVVKYSSSGSLISAKGFGGTKSDCLNGICILNNNEIACVGYSLSSDKSFASLGKKSDGSKKMGVIITFSMN